jgi:toxin ParE1/3/4
MARRTLIWSPRALREIGEIGEYIARDKPEAANRWVEVLMALAERAVAMPHAGRRVPEYGREDLREMIKRGYRVVYLVTDERVEIVAVREGHRRLPKLSSIAEDRPWVAGTIYAGVEQALALRLRSSVIASPATWASDPDIGEVYPLAAGVQCAR